MKRAEVAALLLSLDPLSEAWDNSALRSKRVYVAILIPTIIYLFGGVAASLIVLAAPNLSKTVRNTAAINAVQFLVAGILGLSSYVLLLRNHKFAKVVTAAAICLIGLITATNLVMRLVHGPQMSDLLEPAIVFPCLAFVGRKLFRP